jgi:hypothetical protein
MLVYYIINVIIIHSLGIDVSVGYSEKWDGKTTWKVGYSITTFPSNASFTVSDVSILKKLNSKEQIFQQVLYFYGLGQSTNKSL